MGGSKGMERDGEKGFGGRWEGDGGRNDMEKMMWRGMGEKGVEVDGGDKDVEGMGKRV